jgi:N-glycosylase/DNA lyase
MIATVEPSQHPTSAPAVVLPASDLVALSAPEFNLQATLECGQVFHWVRQGAGYAGVIDRTAVYVEQQGETLLATRGAERIVSRYFGLDHPLAEIYATFPRDEAMRGAVEFARGLRVIRQPLWECLATFLTSSMKQVAHIAQMSHAIRRKYGQAVAPGFYAYPTPAELARATEEELRACSLGYRAKNLLATARMVAEGALDLEALRGLGPAEALSELCRAPGVGVKVANCVLLFGYEHLGAFPIDVWIERVLREHYFKGRRRVTTARLQEYSRDYFGPYGGYAQQYLFHHARKTWQRPRAPKRRRGSRKKS